MRYSSQLILALAALMHAATTIALPTEERACPGPPSVLRALAPETCSKGACSATLFCCTCFSCIDGIPHLPQDSGCQNGRHCIHLVLFSLPVLEYCQRPCLMFFKETTTYMKKSKLPLFDTLRGVSESPAAPR
ncbi:hypothetical protein DFH09DRAFT_1270574, partial [Mycena vulgaris]